VRHDEDGQVLILTVFLAVVLVGLVAVVVDASAAFLARRSLAGTADGAALAAAQEIDLPAYYRTGDLDLAGATETVATYVGDSATVDAVDVTGDTVTVTLRRHLALPLSPPGYAAGIDVTAAATARLRARP